MKELRDIHGNPYSSTTIYFQPYFPNGEMIDRFGNTYPSYVVWKNRATCKNLFPACLIVSFTGDDIEQPEFMLD